MRISAAYTYISQGFRCSEDYRPLTVLLRGGQYEGFHDINQNRRLPVELGVMVCWK